MTTEPKTEQHDADDHFCPKCFAKFAALRLIEAAVANATAAGCEPAEIHDRLVEALDEWFGEREDERLTEETPTAGAA